MSAAEIAKLLLRQEEIDLGDIWEVRAYLDRDSQLHYEAASRIASLEAERKMLREVLDNLANAKALRGVRDLVAGWNGENRPDGPYAERHPAQLGATLPKTTCGAIYELDEALTRARTALHQEQKPATQSTGGAD